MFKSRSYILSTILRWWGRGVVLLVVTEGLVLQEMKEVLISDTVLAELFIIPGKKEERYDSERTV